MKKNFFYATVFAMMAFTSCSQDFAVDEKNTPEWLGESIYAELKTPKNLEGTFNTYLRLIDDLGYTEVLAKTGSKTVFPANDAAFEAFFKDGNNKFGKSSYEQLTTSEKAQLLYSSMLDNAILIGNMSSMKNAEGTFLQGKTIKHPTNISLIQSVEPLFSQQMPSNNKYFAYWKDRGKSINALRDNTLAPMVHFTGEYLLNKNITVEGGESDFYILTGTNYSEGDAFIFDSKVLKSNVTCQNGYIHQIEKVMVNPGNMAEIITNKPSMSYLSRMLNYYAVPVKQDDAFNLQYQQYSQGYGTQDSVYTIRYIAKNTQLKSADKDSKINKVATKLKTEEMLSFDPGWNYYTPSSSIDPQEEIAAIYAPTDDILEKYFSTDGAYIFKNLGVPGLPYDAANIHSTMTRHMDAVYNNDPKIFAGILNNIMQPSFSKSVPSKFSTVQNDVFEFMGIKKSDLRQENGKYVVDIANNGVIYYTSKFFAPQKYNSVLGPATIYTDMRIMGNMLQDHTVDQNNEAKLGANMYYYLMSMTSKYGLFVPTDNDDFYYIDPTSYDLYATKGFMYALKFQFDSNAKDIPVSVQRYMYNPVTHELTIDQSVSPVDISTGTFNTQIQDMLNYHTVVLDKTSGLTGNKYYATKHGGAIMVSDGVATNIGSSKISGGLQIGEGSFKSATVTELFDNSGKGDAIITNGTVFRLDAPIQPCVKPIYDVFNEHTQFKGFFDFCLGFNSTENIYDLLAGDDDSEKSALQNLYVVFDEHFMNNVSAGSYNIYVPTDMELAYNQGLPRWSEIYDRLNNFASYGYASIEEARADCKKRVKVMHDFVNYHIQNTAVFADKNINSGPYSTSCYNSRGIAYELSLKMSGNVMEITDAVKSGRSGRPQTISGLQNIMARDVKYEVTDQTNNYRKILSSTFFTVHGIDKPLCFNGTYGY